jgi:hypothetical protein
LSVPKYFCPFLSVTWAGPLPQHPPVRRVALELTADDVQISLRWHTATVAKPTHTLGTGEDQIEVDARRTAPGHRGPVRSTPDAVPDTTKALNRVSAGEGP